MVNIIQNVLCVCGPERGEQVLLGTVTGQPMDHDLRRKDLQAPSQKDGVFLQRHRRDLALPPERCKVGVLQHVQELELDPGRTGSADVADGLQHIGLVLSGQTEDHVDDELQPTRRQLAHGAVEDGQITENVGGSHTMPTFAKDLAAFLEGTWVEKTEGRTMLDISLGEDNGLDMVMSDGSGRDGKTSFYTMTARFDAVKDALVYNNGTEHEAAITDGSGDETEADAEQGTGAGMFELVPDEEGTGIGELHWTNSEGGVAVFVPAEQ